MRAATTLLFGVFSVAACGASEHPPADRAPPRVVAPAPSVAAPAVRATRCVATPSTIYGDEVVAFVLEGEGTAQVEVVDQRQQSVYRASSPLPGTLRLPQLPSGDFTLRISQSTVSCLVTVNRELPRASSAGR